MNFIINSYFLKMHEIVQCRLLFMHNIFMPNIIYVATLADVFMDFMGFYLYIPSHE